MGMTSQLAASRLIQPGVIASSSDRPAAPYEGQCIYQKDTNQLLVWDGSAWVIPNSPAQNPTGLELVKTQSVGSTAVSSVTVSNAFSGNHDNYRITWTGGGGSVSTIMFLRLDGVTTGYYGSYIGSNYTNGNFVGSYDNNYSWWEFCGHTSMGMNVDVFNPYLAVQKQVMSNLVYYSSSYGRYTGETTDTSSRTGLVIAPASGNISGGVIRVYGYRNS